MGSEVMEEGALVAEGKRKFPESGTGVPGLPVGRTGGSDFIRFTGKSFSGIVQYRILVVLAEDEPADDVRERPDDPEPLDPEIIRDGSITDAGHLIDDSGRVRDGDIPDGDRKTVFPVGAEGYGGLAPPCCFQPDIPEIDPFQVLL
jgi:hypothetical protein